MINFCDTPENFSDGLENLDARFASLMLTTDGDTIAPGETEIVRFEPAPIDLLSSARDFLVTPFEFNCPSIPSFPDSSSGGAINTSFRAKLRASGSTDAAVESDELVEPMIICIDCPRDNRC